MTTKDYIESSVGIEDTGQVIPVFLSHELISLLSSQLYQSPVKAIEELIVNSYDAEASNCYVYAPALDGTGQQSVIIYDDGTGMNKEGLTNLWHIGRSNKRTTLITGSSKRKQIGRFGIGKLAANSIGNKLTYITKHNDEILTVKIDFQEFRKSPHGSSQPLELKVYKFKTFKEFYKSSETLFEVIGYEIKESDKSWTIALIEDLKSESVNKLKLGTLRWVISTAMPLKSDFKVYLNGEEVESSKESYEKYVEFDLKDIGKDRLMLISKSLGENWSLDGEKLKSPTFPQGISGKVIVTKRTLTQDKSTDLQRSHGFFLKVRDRLVNTVDGQVVQKALEQGTFNRFRADLSVDDLDDEIKASRESFEETGLKIRLQQFLREIFNEANSRYDKALKLEDEEGKKAEGEKNIIAPKLVEYPVADALSESREEGSDADDKWFYVNVPKEEAKQVAEQLYSAPRKAYSYNYSSLGQERRLVSFNPSEARFTINQDHEIAKEYGSGVARAFLQDFATAEAMLEIYLREARIQPHIIGSILEKRDQLLRNLVIDHVYSNQNIAQRIKDSKDDERELEIIQVVAMRSLGFVAKHISNGDNPDGIARFTSFPDNEIKIILEAKSSINVPSLGAIDFGTLERHTAQQGAQGCLLLAPDFPGQIREEKTGKVAAASEIAERLRISCWKVDTFAKFIEYADQKRLTARDLIRIVTNNFSPRSVTDAVNTLIEDRRVEYPSLYIKVLRILKIWENKSYELQRTLGGVYGALSLEEDIDTSVVTSTVIDQVLKEISHSSNGGMIYNNPNISLNISIEELERRIAHLIGDTDVSKRKSSFKQ